MLVCYRAGPRATTYDGTLQECDRVECLVNRFSKRRLKRVKSKSEGFSFIKKCFSRKKLPKPQWLNDSQPYYPPLWAIRKYICITFNYISEDDSKSAREEDGYTSDDYPPPQHYTKNINTNAEGGGLTSPSEKVMSSLGWILRVLMF